MKISMPTAIKGEKKSQDLSFPVIQTLGVNDTRCVGSILCEQGDRVHVRLSQFSRFSPLVAPTFGDFKIKTHVFWVPERIIWTHNLEYLNDSLDASFDEIKQPVNFSLKELYSAMIQDGMLSFKADFATTAADGYEKKGNGKPKYDVNLFDFVSETGKSYNFSAHGRMVFSSLQALGYALPLYAQYIVDPEYSDTDYYKFWNNQDYSIYPLLAFLRVFYDWIYPSQYVTQQGLGIFFTDDFVKSWSLDESYRIDYLMQAFDLMFNPYDKSFWTSLWAKPTQVAQNTPTGRGTSNLGIVHKSRNNVGNGTYLDVGSKSGPGDPNSSYVSRESNDLLQTLTSDALRWLESVSDFVLRSNIGGTRVREFLKSHFGFVPSDVQSNVSIWIRTFADRVQIQDVTNMSSTSSVLGEQGGKAISSGNGALKFEASEKGYLIFVSQIVPAVGYYQGVAKECRAIKSRFDLYLPDFDSVSMEAVPRRALFNQYRDYEDFEKISPSSLDDVLGYSPRDAERKIKRAVLSGDFLFNSRNTGLDSYHTFRDVLYNRNNLAIDARFLEADNQTQRIFAYMGENVDSGMYAQYDKIFNEMYFEVTKFSMMKSLSQSLPFFDEDGKRVNVDYEGQYV